jgi:glutathione S-transferase
MSFSHLAWKTIVSRLVPAPLDQRIMKLYRFRYSPYALKVQMLLDLMGAKYELIEAKYGDRRELARLTGGYIYVPVLVSDDGTVTVESRDICERLLVGAAKERLTPSPFEGPVWAYADFCDGPLEDVLFRIASPAIQQTWEDPFERALYTLIKERKFGPGCIDLWREQQDTLFARGQRLLSGTAATLERSPFLFGKQPTLADAALYGNLAMLHLADSAFVTRLGPVFGDYLRRLESAASVAG